MTVRPARFNSRSDFKVSDQFLICDPSQGGILAVPSAVLVDRLADSIKDQAIQGADGRGIESIVRTSGTGAPGTTDTYTITFTDASTTTFTVYNGADGAGGGGTVTSVGMSVPTGLQVSGSPVTSSGTLAVTFDAGYSIPTTAKQSEWDGKEPAISKAIGYAKWNGTAWVFVNDTYLTSYTETDPVFLASAAAGITGTKIGNWDAAYAWGNHASAGYLTSAAIGTTVQPYDADLTSWAAIAPSAKQDTLVSGTNIKTINSASLLGAGDIALVAAANGTASGITLNDGYTEEVFEATGTTPALSPANGSIQTWTLSGASTPTAGTWAAGQSITLMIDDGSANTINWTGLAVTWKTDGGSAPTLNATGYTVIALWKVGTTIYGARVGDA